MPKAKITFEDIEQTVNVPAGTRAIEISELDSEPVGVPRKMRRLLLVLPLAS